MKTNIAELEITAYQLMYPSIHYRRIDCLDCIFTTSNFEWKDGKLIPVFPNENYEKIKNKILNNKAITVEEALLQRELANAQEQISKGHYGEEKTVEELARKNFEYTIQKSHMPKTFRISSTYKYEPIWKIPDDVHPDFLAICIEYLNAVIESKIDFDEKSILSPMDLKYHFGENGNGLTEQELSSRKAFSVEISKILAKADGQNWPPDKEYVEKQQKDWDDYWSPAARAKRANAENIESRKAAATILEDLKNRKLIP